MSTCKVLSVLTNTTPPIPSQYISRATGAGEAALVVGAGLVTATIASGTLVDVCKKHLSGVIMADQAITYIHSAVTAVDPTSPLQTYYRADRLTTNLTMQME